MNKIIKISILILTLLLFVITFMNLNKNTESFESILKKTTICNKGQIKYELSCLENIFNNIGDPELSADIYLKLAENQSSLGENCHQFLHTLGKNLINNKAPILYESNKDSTRLSSCGYGFLHGYFENIKLTGNKTKDISLIDKSCKNLTKLPNKRVLLECFHALGHAISENYKDLNDAKDLCNSAFILNNEAKIGCYGGLAMKIRDSYLLLINQGNKFPPTIEWFVEVGRNCESNDQLWTISCAPGFVQLATDQGLEYVKPFLIWCSDILSDATQCYQQAGVYLGHFSERLGSSDELIKICSSSSNNKNYLKKCIISIPEGRMNAGVSKLNAVRFICPNIESKPYCREIHNYYKI